MKQVTIVPQGGLCNRLRVVLSALMLSRPDVSLRVDWACNAECRANFADLFATAPLTPLLIGERRWWNVPQSRRNLHLPALLRRACYDLQLVNFNGATDDSLPRLIDTYNNIYVSTGYVLQPYSAHFAQLLHPVPALQQRIDDICRTFEDRVVGVHIRRTDSVRSIAESTDAAFLSAMQREVDADANVRFFLATDSLPLRAHLEKAFPGRIVAQPIRSVRRDTLSGMQDAVVDLFCLSRTRKLLGSYWSSFSDMAAELSGIPLQIVKTSHP